MNRRGLGNFEMHLYWRIIEELKYLGEVLVFHDPSLKRSYEAWVRSKTDVLSMLEMEDEKNASPLLQFLMEIQSMN